MIPILDIFRSSNAFIQKYGQDAAPEVPNSGMSAFGGKADIQCLLSGTDEIFRR